MLKTLIRHRKTITTRICCQFSTDACQPGLFGISKLREPEDWSKLAEEAVARYLGVSMMHLKHLPRIHCPCKVTEMQVQHPHRGCRPHTTLCGDYPTVG